MRNRTTGTSRSIGTCLVALLLGVSITASARANTYNPGWMFETWEITDGPPNTSYELEAHYRSCSWSPVMTAAHGQASGTTDSSGKHKGWLTKAPGTGRQPFYGAVRAVFSNGTKVKLKIKKSGIFSCINVEGGGGGYYASGEPATIGPQAWVITQNVPELTDDAGVVGWLLPGTWVSITLPEHFTFTEMPLVHPILTVPSLLFGPPILEDEGRTLSVMVLQNDRLEPGNGLVVDHVFIAYDGVGIPFEYRGTITAEIDLTEVGDPTAVVYTGPVIGNIFAGTVLDDPAYTWFDETNGGGGFTDFASLQSTHASWAGTFDDRLDLEDLPEGERLAEQYLGSHGVFFTGADGGNDNEFGGIRPEGAGTYVENLTGYDGSYQPDGSQVYLRFQNTTENPDAPLTIEFAEPQCKVAAFVACGTQGTEHSFTITVSDGSGAALSVKTAQAELWETDPANQNCETLIAVESPIPNIRSVEILNNSLVEYADALILDTIEMETCIAVVPGDVTFDGSVGFDDLLAVISRWGACDGLCAEDSDGDGVVGFGDLLDVLSNWS